MLTKTNMNLRIVINNIKNIFSIKIIILTILLFCILYHFQLPLLCNSIDNISSVSEIYKICFYGTNTVTDNLQSFFAWILFEMFLLLILINYLFGEISGRNIYSISRLGSKNKWFLSTEITIIASCLIYFLIGFISIYICIIGDGKEIFNNFGLVNILSMLLVICLNNIFYVHIYLIISFSIKHKDISIILLIILIVISIDLGNIFNIDLYIPFTQSIMAKHDTKDISLFSSMLLLMISNVLAYIILYIKIIKNDLINLIN